MFGSGGSAYGNYSETTTTTTQGTRVVPITSSVTRYDYFASYWVEVKPGRFGAYLQDLTPEQRAQIERNRGVAILVVQKDTPAFNADLLAGDIILNMDGRPVVDFEDFISRIESSAGQDVLMEYWRDGHIDTKLIRLGG